ncbi:MAG: T9SS type A sorting domain-containing protein [Bacteroidia bacterium]|nr:T9SS type A sorting domain-containing protein [Bacteroidia bacterium]
MVLQNYLLFVFILLIFLIPARAFSQAGLLDASFGDNGMVIPDFSNYALAKAVAIQSDGKIIAGGETGGSGFKDIVLVRLNEDGQLDSGFGNNGIVTTNLGFDEELSSVVLDSDGKIVTAGTSYNPSGNIFLARFDTNGAPDSSFATNGFLLLDFGGFEEVHELIIQNDGKLVIAGSFSADITLARFINNGQLDSSFGTDGIVTNDFSGYGDYCFSAAMQPDGKIVVGGEADADFLIARYNANGTLDNSFSIDGYLTFSIQNNCYGGYICLQDDGKILHTGATGGGGSIDGDLVVARFKTDGAPDPTFGTDGIITTVISDWAIGTSILQQPDQKIIVAGTTQPSVGSSNILVIRYLENGTLDSSFNDSGIVITNTGANDDIRDCTLQSDGKLVGVGRSDGGNFIILRYLTDIGVNTSAPALHSFTIYPNPASVKLFIHSCSIGDRISIVDLHGRVRKKVTSGSDSTLELDISDLANGIYFVVLNSSKELQKEKIVIAH